MIKKKKYLKKVLIVRPKKTVNNVRFLYFCLENCFFFNIMLKNQNRALVRLFNYFCGT